MGFEDVRGDAVAQGGMVALTVVEHLDVLRDSEARSLAGGEPVAVVHLVLQGGEERFRGGVIEALTG